jgi:hypothetical protein
LQHLLHLAGEVRQRAVGERKRRRIEHRDLSARHAVKRASHDKWRAAGIDRGGGTRRSDGEQQIAP